MKSTIVILCLENQLAAWQLVAPCSLRRMHVQGQECLSLQSSETLVEAYADLVERLRGEGLAVGEVTWLMDKGGRELWAAGLPQLEKLPMQPIVWQCLSWEWLAGRFGLSDAAPWEALARLTGEILPWLVSTDDAAERRQMQETLAREHQSESERLGAARVHLQQENERLRAQNAALQQVDVDRLVSFLPALFPRVFTVLGAVDLALLSGRVEPPNIPNPYPEQSEEALRVLQRNFRTLPRELQRQIVGFVARLPHRQKLQVRPEMRELVLELEGN